MGAMTSKQKEFYAHKAVDLAHIVVAALVVGQLLREEVDWVLLAIGFLLFLGLYSVSYWLTREE